MKIQFVEEITVEGETEITSDEITECLHYDLARRKDDLALEMENDDREKYKRRVVLNFISSIHQCLNAITPEMIGMISDLDKGYVFDALIKSFRRFDPIEFELKKEDLLFSIFKHCELVDCDDPEIKSEFDKIKSKNVWQFDHENYVGKREKDLINVIKHCHLGFCDEETKSLFNEINYPSIQNDEQQSESESDK